MLPLKHWFAEGGALRQELEDRFFSDTARIHRYFRPDGVKQLVTGHNGQTRDNSVPLWQLLFLENWLEHVHDPATSKRAVYCNEPDRLRQIQPVV